MLGPVAKFWDMEGSLTGRHGKEDRQEEVYVCCPPELFFCSAGALLIPVSYAKDSKDKLHHLPYTTMVLLTLKIVYLCS